MAYYLFCVKESGKMFLRSLMLGTVLRSCNGRIIVVWS